MLPTLVTQDMRYWRLAPDPRLRAQVSCYWIMDGASSAVATDELLIPDGHSEIVFNRCANGFERWKLGDKSAATRMRGSYLIGGRSHSIGTACSESLELAGVKLDSRFLRALIRTPLAEFRDGTLAFRDLAHRGLLDLEDAVAHARAPSAVASLLDEFFLRALRELSPRRTATDALLERIRRDRGDTQILRWANDERVDPRSLERGFCAATGMTPKQYARVIRFKHSYGTILRKDCAALRGAQLDGYYDQSHFNREFRHFMGVAPTARINGRMPAGMTVSDHLLQAEL